MEIQKIVVDRDRGIIMLATSGKISAAELIPFSTAIDDTLNDDCKTMVFDFSALDFINSMGIGKLVVTHKRCVEKGGCVVLCGVNSKLAKLFEILCLDGVFKIFRTTEEAMKTI